MKNTAKIERLTIDIDDIYEEIRSLHRERGHLLGMRRRLEEEDEQSQD